MLARAWGQGELCLKGLVAASFSGLQGDPAQGSSEYCLTARRKGWRPRDIISIDIDHPPASLGIETPPAESAIQVGILSLAIPSGSSSAGHLTASAAVKGDKLMESLMLSLLTFTVGSRSA